MEVYEVHVWRDGQWTRWGVYLYEAMAQAVAQRRTQAGQEVRVHVLDGNEERGGTYGHPPGHP